MGELYSVVCAMFWAVGVILMRLSGESVGPLALNVFKNSLTTLLMLITLPILGVAFLPESARSSDWIVLMISGALGLGIADTLFLAALNKLGAARMAIVECAYGPCVVLCAALHPQLLERPGPPIIVGIVLVAAGLVLAAHGPRSKDEESETERRELGAGFALGILALFLMAVGFVIAKPVLERHDVWWVILVRFLGAYAVLIPMSLRARVRSEVLAVFKPGAHWRLVVPAAFLGTYCAMIFWISGLKYTKAMTAAVLNQTSTFFIVILAAIILGERLSARRLVAVFLGFSGALVVGLF